MRTIIGRFFDILILLIRLVTIKKIESDKATKRQKFQSFKVSCHLIFSKIGSNSRGYSRPYKNLHGDIDNFGDIANIATFASVFFFFRLLRRNAIQTSLLIRVLS